MAGNTSKWSIRSERSILSIGSTGSILSIGSGLGALDRLGRQRLFDLLVRVVGEHRLGAELAVALVVRVAPAQPWRVVSRP